MSKFDFKRFLPITKIDEEERMVYGWASTPDLDSDGEVIKAEALEKALPNYLKFPTLREMHQPKVAGTVKNAEATKKGLYIGAYVVNNDAWELVKAGAYKAFSIGGNVKKKVGNMIQELDLVEISLVDVPANPAAVIEVWKSRGMTKDAETAYSMANLMIQVKDMISYYEYLGKDTKMLKKCLEMIKKQLVTEAGEEEPKMGEDGPMKGKLFAAKTKEELTDSIKMLESMDFGDNKIADALRKGVILGMNKQKEEIVEDPKETEEEVKETPTNEETTTSEEETPAGEEKPEVEEEKEEEEKETGELDADLEKLNTMTEDLAKLSTKKEVEEPKVEGDLAKFQKTVTGSLIKVVELLTEFADRLAKVEETPAAPKSRSTVVHKTIGSNEEEDPKKEDSAEATRIKGRLAELDKLHDDLGKNEFAKRGYAKEAGRLQEELATL